MEKTPCDRREFLNNYINVKDYVIFDGTMGTIHKDYKEFNNVVIEKEQSK